MPRRQQNNAPVPPMTANITFKLCVKEGLALQDVRGEVRNAEFIFPVNQGFNVLQPMVLNEVASDGGSFEWDGALDVYLRHRVPQPQREYTRLTAENFLPAITTSYNVRSNHIVDGGFKAYIFVYVRKPNPVNPAGDRIVRAGQRRIALATERIREFRAQNPGNDDVGAVAQAQWAQNIARQDFNDNPLERPDNFAFRQAVRIDAAPAPNSNEFARVEVRFNADGPVIPLWFNIGQLRTAFNLPSGLLMQDMLVARHNRVEDNLEDEEHLPEVPPEGIN